MNSSRPVFHSPKSLTPSPPPPPPRSPSPRLSDHLVIFYFYYWMTIENYFNSKWLLTSATVNMKFQFLFKAVKTSWLLIFLRLITGNFRGFFVLFLFDYFGDSRITFPPFLFCTRSVYGRARNDQKAGKVQKTIRLHCRQACGRPRIISSMKNSI